MTKREPYCRIAWHRESYTGVWVDAEPRPDDAEQLEWCMRVADAIGEATTKAELEATAEALRVELGYDAAWVSGFDEPLDLAVYMEFRGVS